MTIADVLADRIGPIRSKRRVPIKAGDGSKTFFLKHVSINRRQRTEMELRNYFWERVNKNGPNGCWLWTSWKTPGGYGAGNFNGVFLIASRLSVLLHNGKLDTTKAVCHKCDNRRCVNPDHLYEGTYKENFRDMFVRGRYVFMRGSANGHSKLNEQQVKEIRESFSPRRITKQMLADKFCISLSVIEQVIARKTWKHVV